MTCILKFNTILTLWDKNSRELNSHGFAFTACVEHARGAMLMGIGIPLDRRATGTSGTHGA